MDIQGYINQINVFGAERRPEKAILLCKKIREIAIREGVSVVHINNVYKQLVDNGMVNKDELSKFKMAVAEQWGKSVGLDSSIIIGSGDDIEIE